MLSLLRTLKMLNVRFPTFLLSYYLYAKRRETNRMYIKLN